jgi:nucleoside diphosphate kinase
MDERAGRWHRHVFCMLTPDCLRRHLARQVLDRFLEAGFETVSWRLVSVSTADIDAMSEAQNAGPGQVYRYRALDVLFGLGPALALALRDQRGRDAAEIYGTVKRLKGDAHPERARPGSLRHDLRAINVVLSLLHASDTPEASALETAILLGRNAGPSGGSLLPGGQSHGLDDVLDLLERSQPRETRLFPEVLTALRARMSVALWPALSPDGRRLVAQLADKGQLAAPDAGERLRAEMSPSGPATDCPGRSAGLEEVLSIRFDGSRAARAMPEIEMSLRTHGIQLDPWEYAVLATSVYFPPRR